MFRVRLVSVVVLLLVAGCGSAGSDGEPATTVPAGGTPTQAPGTTQPGATAPSSTSASTQPAPDDQAALDLPLVPQAELPEGMPPIPVPDGGERSDYSFLNEESVIYDYPSGTLPSLITFYEAWFRTQGIDPGPTFGSSPSRFWNVVVAGVPVRFEIYSPTNRPLDVLAIVWPE